MGRSNFDLRSDTLHGARYTADDLVDLVARDDEWRREADDVAVRHRSHDHTFFHTGTCDLDANPLRRIEVRALLRVLRELDCCEQSITAHLSDEWSPRELTLQALQQVGAD